MKTVDKSQLTAQLLELLQLVELEGEDILVMDGNKPVVRISQYEKSLSTEELFKEMRGKVKYFEDLTTPIFI
jgi:antitoxin (DNA-binding transcriptional repressor) of toxin-antitoxin stability system